MEELAKKTVSVDDRTAEIAAAFAAGVKFAELGKGVSQTVEEEKEEE